MKRTKCLLCGKSISKFHLVFQGAELKLCYYCDMMYRGTLIPTIRTMIQFYEYKAKNRVERDITKVLTNCLLVIKDET